MAEKARVIRIRDYDRRSREPDAEGPRDPCESAAIIILPVVRVKTHRGRTYPHDEHRRRAT